MIKKVGNGGKTRFWLDTWVGERPLCQEFPRLFLVSEQKEECINQMGVWRNEVWEWDLKWRRRLFVWEEELERNLVELVENVNLNHDEDLWMCDIGVDGVYSVRDGYVFLSENVLPQVDINGDICRVLKMNWESLAPLKVLIFSWQLLLQRLPTRVNLAKRRVIVAPSSSYCVWCPTEEESESHLFLTCPMAMEVWIAINAWLGVTTVVPGNLLHSFESFGFPFRCKKLAKGLSLIWQTVVWSLWRARNGFIFDGLKLKANEIVDAIKHRSLQWFIAKKHGCVHLSYEWEKFPIDCLNR